MAAAANLQRVRSKIERVVIEFLDQLIEDGFSDFRIENVRAYVESCGVTVAPDSPGRILRMLRREGVVDYWIVNRSESLYRIVSVNGRT